MGYYIEVPDKKGKAQQLVDLHGAAILPQRPEGFWDVPEDKALICVVVNNSFDAAFLVHDKDQYIIATAPDPREKWWLLMDKSLAYELAGYTS